MNAPITDGQRRYAFGLSALINFIVFAAAMAAMPVLFTEIAEELGLNLVEIGAVWGLTSTAGIFTIIIGGLLADRYGTRRVLAVFCVGAGIFGALRGISSSLSELVVTSLLFGAFAEAVPVIVIKSISQLFHDRGLGASQGVLTACVGGGMMVGAMISATVLSPLFGGWQYVLYFYGGLSALLGILWYFTIPATAGQAHESAAERPSLRESFARVLRCRNVWFTGIAMMGFAGSNKGLMGYLSIFLQRGGWSNVAADASLAVYNAAGTAAAIPLTMASDRLGKRRAILVPAMIVSTIGIALIGFTSGAAFWLVIIVTGAFRDMIWAMAATMTVESEGIGPGSAGAAVGIVHAFTRLGYTYAPAAGNALAAVNPGGPFLLWAGLCALGLLFFALAKETGRGRRKTTTP